MKNLSLDQVGLHINGKQILRDINLELGAGETLGVVGESGSGKSMTALSIMQLLPRGSELSGTVRLGSTELTSLDESAMCDVRGDDIGMIFQEPMTALNPVRTIGDQVAETVLIHTDTNVREAHGMARRMLDRVGLSANRFPLDRYPHELSGGQRQRVVIAMAIALQPDVLIADEPTTALDVTTQQQVLDILRTLVDQDGMSLILITHDLAVVSKVAGQIAIMKSGEIVEHGRTLDVFRYREHAYTRQLIEASGHVPIRARHADRYEPLLQVTNLVRDYRLPRTSLFSRPSHFRAVDHVSFELFRGESLGLVGESGCGKSTLTRAILGLEVSQGGTIEIDGLVVEGGHRMPARLRSQMQVVFQDPYGSFNPRHKVGRLIAEPLHLLPESVHGSARQRRVEESLRSVGLDIEDADKYIHEFSGGQRQRIAIARALVIRPPLIILDEAVSALDVSIRAQILDLLAALGDSSGLSYLFISHDLSVVRHVTDRVLVMRDGRIVERGKTEDVFTRPQHAYTRELIAAVPKLPSSVRRPADQAR